MKRVVLIILVAIFISACGINRGMINSYVEPTYREGSIKKIAVFSIRNARFAPSEARMLNKELIQGLLSKNPSVEVVSPSESLRKINDSEIAEQWADFVEDYYTSGIANKNILSKVAKILDVDAVLQGQLVNVYQVDGNNWNQNGQTRVTLNFSIVETATAKTIWDASADGIKGNKLEFDPAPPISDALELAMEKVIENMPRL